MKKILLLCLSAWTLIAGDYMSFEKRVLENSPRLKALRMEVDAAKIEGEIALRYANPELEAEASRYDMDRGGDDNGWRLSLAQPMRMIGLGDDLKGFADLLQLGAEAGVADEKSDFIIQLRSAYLEWVKAHRTAGLAQEEITLAKRLTHIAEERFKEGAGTRAQVMQARLEADDARMKRLEAQQRSEESYGKLLALTGMRESFRLNPQFLYPLESITTTGDISANSRVKRRETEGKLLEADAKRNDYALKEWKLGAEYEEEPDQSITRLNIGIELPFFNANREERRLALLRAEQKKLEAKRLKASLQTQMESLARRYEQLLKLHTGLKERIDRQEALLRLFEEGYRTAKTSLLDLIATKNGLIDSRRRLLDIEYRANLYRLQIDYLQGRIQ